MLLHAITALASLAGRLHRDDRGEVNASMIAWMVVSALVVFGFRTQLGGMLSAAAGFVTSTLGI